MPRRDLPLIEGLELEESEIDGMGEEGDDLDDDDDHDRVVVEGCNCVSCNQRRQDEDDDDYDSSDDWDEPVREFDETAVRLAVSDFLSNGNTWPFPGNAELMRRYHMTSRECEEARERVAEALVRREAGVLDASGAVSECNCPSCTRRRRERQEGRERQEMQEMQEAPELVRRISNNPNGGKET